MNGESRELKRKLEVFKRYFFLFVFACLIDIDNVSAQPCPSLIEQGMGFVVKKVKNLRDNFCKSVPHRSIGKYDSMIKSLKASLDKKKEIVKEYENLLVDVINSKNFKSIKSVLKDMNDEKINQAKKNLDALSDENFFKNAGLTLLKDATGNVVQQAPFPVSSVFSFALDNADLETRKKQAQTEYNTLNDQGKVIDKIASSTNVEDIRKFAKVIINSELNESAKVISNLEKLKLEREEISNGNRKSVSCAGSSNPEPKGGETFTCKKISLSDAKQISCKKGHFIREIDSSNHFKSTYKCMPEAANPENLDDCELDDLAKRTSRFIRNDLAKLANDVRKLANLRVEHDGKKLNFLPGRDGNELVCLSFLKKLPFYPSSAWWVRDKIDIEEMEDEFELTHNIKSNGCTFKRGRDNKWIINGRLSISSDPSKIYNMLNNAANGTVSHDYKCLLKLNPEIKTAVQTFKEWKDSVSKSYKVPQGESYNESATAGIWRDRYGKYYGGWKNGNDKLNEQIVFQGKHNCHSTIQVRGDTKHKHGSEVDLCDSPLRFLLHFNNMNKPNWFPGKGFKKESLDLGCSKMFMEDRYKFVFDPANIE